MITISFIIRVLVGILGYFIIGSVYMFHRRGARGVEVIPNLVFWKELPLLLKASCHNIIERLLVV